MKRFRTSMMHRAGTDPALFMQGRIVDTNLVNWTVNVVATFDRKRWFDIQVASPYLNPNNGEGIFCFPEVGSTCVVCVPGDSSPPFVSAFVMPHEIINSATDDSPLGTRSHGAPAKNATDASFAGGRPKAKPGDIYLRTRDGNFITLHRGGVLSVGSTELAQRMYIPLGNLIRDISEAYEHHNAAGSITWGIQDGPSQVNFPAQFMQTFRVFANDKYADIRVATGRVFSPVPEPDGGVQLAAAGVGQGANNPIIMEVVVSPKGFIAESGDPVNAAAVKDSVFRFTFDRTGNTLLRCEGNLAIHVKKKIILGMDDAMEVTSGKNIAVTAKEGIDIDGGVYTHIKGQVVRLGPGKDPAARLQDLTTSYIPIPVPAVFVPAITGPMISGVPIPGVFALITPAGQPVPIGGSIVTGQALVRQ